MTDEEQPTLANEWSLGEDAFAAIVADVSPLAPRVIVEFGSGSSSVRLAKAFPGAEVLSIESAEEYAAQTRSLAAEHGITAPHLRVEHRPLTFQMHGLGRYESYGPGAFPDSIDMVLIDGPPHWTRRGREACLYQVASRLRVGARVYLDDYGRQGERRMMQNWLAVFGSNLRARELTVGHGVGVLEVQAPLVSSFAARVVLDAWQNHGRRLLQLGTARVR